jgi:Matrixin
MRRRAGAVLTPAYHPDVAFGPRSSEFGTAERSTAVRTALAALLLIGQLTATPHWAPGARIAVWIDLTRAPVGAAPLVERAMKNWSDASNGQLTLVRVNARADAAIRVLFVQSDTNYGEAAPRLDPASGFIVRADVAINAAVPDDLMTARIIVYLTALHELGHALGLAHSDTFSAIMYRFRRADDGARYFGAYKNKVHALDDVGSSRATGLDPEDVTALLRLYGP